MAILKFEDRYVLIFKFGEAERIRDKIFKKFNIIKTNFGFDPAEQFNMTESDKYKFYFSRNNFGCVTKLEILKKWGSYGKTKKRSNKK